MGESEHLASAWLWNFTKYQITCSLLPGHPGPLTDDLAARFLPCIQSPSPAGPALALQVTPDTLPPPPLPQRAAEALPATPHPPAECFTRHTEPEFVLSQDKGWIWQYFLIVIYRILIVIYSQYRKPVRCRGKNKNLS